MRNKLRKCIGLCQCQRCKLTEDYVLGCRNNALTTYIWTMDLFKIPIEYVFFSVLFPLLSDTTRSTGMHNLEPLCVVEKHGEKSREPVQPIDIGDKNPVINMP